MNTNISIQEATYVDPRAGNDKFFRTFAFGSSWVTQYGRNGTIGTFTKIVEAASPEAAQSAAGAKFASKVKKGYNPVRSGVVASAVPISASNLTFLDELAEILPIGTTQTIVSPPVDPVALTQPRAADVTQYIAPVLTIGFGTRMAEPSDINPSLPTRPMLASVQSPEAVSRMMGDPAWYVQYKYDGDRVVIEVVDGDIRVLNRQGEAKSKNVGTAHLQPFTALRTGRWIFDGEVVGRTLVLFDLLAATDHAISWVRAEDPFEQRYHALIAIAKTLGIHSVEAAGNLVDPPVMLAPLAMATERKAEFLTKAISEQREGIILRHAQGTYEPGRRSNTLVKHKLVKDVDVVISSLHGSKQSATLSVHDEDGTLVEVGAASTIGKGAVNIGDVWVVTFLYVTNPEHPRLFQPRLVHRRDDKSAKECTIDQFANAGTDRKV